MNDKNDWVATVEAVKYRFGPFIAPHPSEELGLGPNHRSSLGRSSNQIRPLTSSGPRRGEADAPLSTWNGSRRSHVQDISTPRSHGTHPSVPRRRDSQDPAFSARVMSNPPERRQVISLSERFPGDQTHRPLDIIRHESKRAHRSPHLRRGHIPGPDSIDRLDIIGAAYHHEGPYDAALLARNRSHKSSPLQAVRASNEEALKATPMEKIQDSIERHRPLDGVATIPPGMRDLSGRVMQYEEGSNMMIEDGGNYKRWPGVHYHPDDIKGKGEPSFTLERSLKQHRPSYHRRVFSDGGAGYEMTAPGRPPGAEGSDENVRIPPSASYRDWQEGIQRRNTTGRSMGQNLRKRLGSLGGKGIS